MQKNSVASSGKKVHLQPVRDGFLCFMVSHLSSHLSRDKVRKDGEHPPDSDSWWPSVDASFFITAPIDLNTTITPSHLLRM